MECGCEAKHSCPDRLRRQSGHIRGAGGEGLASGGGMDSQFAKIMNIVGIIPARYASTRFPGKPLHLIAGKPLIQRVVEQCQQAKALSEVIVATDDPRIAEVAKKFCRVEMT